MGRCVLLLLSLAACSSSGGSSTSSSSGTLGDGGSASSSSGGSSTSSTSSSSTSSTSTSSGGPQTYEQCVASCESLHPHGKALGAAIDSCWSKSCSKECSDIGGGTLQEADHGTCKNTVATPSKDCSQCTVDNCCTYWDACFSDQDCKALNTCTNACNP